jgi:hypothetical protein
VLLDFYLILMLLKKAGAFSRRHSLVFLTQQRDFYVSSPQSLTTTTNGLIDRGGYPPIGFCFNSFELALKTTEGGWGSFYPSFSGVFNSTTRYCRRDRRQHPQQCLLYDTLRMTTLRLALVLMLL